MSLLFTVASIARVILAPMPLPPLSTQLVATKQRVQDSCDIACMHIVPTVRSQDTSFRHPPASRPAPRASRLALVASRRAVPRGTRLRRAAPCRILRHTSTPSNRATPPRAVPLQGRRRNSTEPHGATRSAVPRAPSRLHRVRSAVAAAAASPGRAGPPAVRSCVYAVPRVPPKLLPPPTQGARSRAPRAPRRVLHRAKSAAAAAASADRAANLGRGVPRAPPAQRRAKSTNAAASADRRSESRTGAHHCGCCVLRRAKSAGAALPLPMQAVQAARRGAPRAPPRPSRAARCKSAAGPGQLGPAWPANGRVRRSSLPRWWWPWLPPLRRACAPSSLPSPAFFAIPTTIVPISRLARHWRYRLRSNATDSALRPKKPAIKLTELHHSGALRAAASDAVGRNRYRAWHGAFRAGIGTGGTDCGRTRRIGPLDQRSL